MTFKPIFTDLLWFICAILGSLSHLGCQDPVRLVQTRPRLQQRVRQHPVFVRNHGLLWPGRAKAVLAICHWLSQAACGRLQVLVTAFDHRQEDVWLPGCEPGRLLAERDDLCQLSQAAGLLFQRNHARETENCGPWRPILFPSVVNHCDFPPHLRLLVVVRPLSASASTTTLLYSFISRFWVYVSFV